MKPAQVLDYQRALRDALRTGHYRNYLDGFLESMSVKSGMAPSRTVAHQGDAWADSEIRVLEIAYAFHVDAEMTPLIRHAGAGMDEDFTWQKEVFPTDRGFLMFDDPLTLRELRQRTMRTAAVTWHWGAGPNGQAGVWLAMYSKWDDLKDEVAVELREKMGDAKMRALGPLHINHVAFVPWGHTVGVTTAPIGAREAAHYAVAGDPIESGTTSDNPLRDLYTTLLLMGQTITVVDDEQVTPALKRHLGKKHIPARVVIIRLRRTEGSRQPGETMVDWAYRWVVRAYWRKQRYGPGLSQVKVILIAPFVKGPADKPLHISDKVYDLSR